MAANGRRYGVVRDLEVKTYQDKPNLLDELQTSKATETRMHYTICCQLGFI